MFSNSIVIIHSGSIEDISLCESIYRHLSTESCRVDFQKQIPKRNGHQEVLRKLRYYESNNYSLFAIISQPFFDLVWPTELKNEIVRILTKYSNKRCLHVWAPDVTIDDVRKRSTVLTVNEGTNFRQVSFSMLQGLNSREITVKLSELLNEWSPDEKFIRDYEAKSVPLAPPISSVSRKHVQPGRMVYSREPALHFTDISAASYGGHRSRQSKRQISQRKVHSNKHKSAINTSMSPQTLLSSMKYGDIFKLSDLFGERSASDGSIKGVGHDVQSLSSLFRLSKDDVAQLGLAHLRGQRPLELLIRTLNMREPDLTVGELEKEFETIKRFDAAKYIRDNVYSY